MAILQCIFWLMLMTFIIDLLSLTLLSVISLLVPSSIYYLHALTFHIHCVSCLSLCINLLVTTLLLLRIYRTISMRPCIMVLFFFFFRHLSLNVFFDADWVGNNDNCTSSSVLLTSIVILFD